MRSRWANVGATVVLAHYRGGRDADAPAKQWVADAGPVCLVWQAYLAADRTAVDGGARGRRPNLVHGRQAVDPTNCGPCGEARKLGFDGYRLDIIIATMTDLSGDEFLE